MTIETPFGPVQAAVNADGALTELKFGPSGGHADRNSAVAKQLAEFFAGARKTFDLPMAPEGTDFQKRVWAELIRIPYGETISYAELARRVGSDGAARGWQSQCDQSNRDRRPLPSGDRRGWLAHRIRIRRGNEAQSVGFRARASSPARVVLTHAM